MRQFGVIFSSVATTFKARPMVAHHRTGALKRVSISLFIEIFTVRAPPMFQSGCQKGIVPNIRGGLKRGSFSVVSPKAVCFRKTREAAWMVALEHKKQHIAPARAFKFDPRYEKQKLKTIFLGEV